MRMRHSSGCRATAAVLLACYFLAAICAAQIDQQQQLQRQKQHEHETGLQIVQRRPLRCGMNAHIGQQLSADRHIMLLPNNPVTAPSRSTAADVLVVTLLDGRVVALDAGNGRVLWTHDTGAPLLSARQQPGRAPALSVFPGTDGGLYAYSSGMGQTVNAGLQRLPVTLPELVDAAPSLTADGSVLLGRRDSSVLLLDAATGRHLLTLSNTDDTLEDHNIALGAAMVADYMTKGWPAYRLTAECFEDWGGVTSEG